jgi:hypothetical protein
MTYIDKCEHIRLTLIANAAALQHCTGTAANVIPLPGTDRFITIGTAAEVARLLEIAPVAQEVTQQAALSYVNSQRKMIERAIIGLRDGWATRKDADDALALLTPTTSTVSASGADGSAA